MLRRIKVLQRRINQEYAEEIDLQTNSQLLDSLKDCISKDINSLGRKEQILISYYKPIDNGDIARLGIYNKVSQPFDVRYSYNSKQQFESEISDLFGEIVGIKMEE